MITDEGLKLKRIQNIHIREHGGLRERIEVLPSVRAIKDMEVFIPRSRLRR